MTTTQSYTPVLDGLVLAAGRGARFGGDKLLVDLGGAPLVARALATAFAAPVRRVCVAVAEDARLIAAIQDSARGLGAADRLVLVPVPDAAQGMGVSLRTAAAALADDTGGAFVFLGDMPAIAPRTPARLAAALGRRDQIIAPTHGGKRGHPVLFGADWLEALRTLDGDEGARALLIRAGPRLVTVEVDDPGVHLDVDRPEDLARIG
jgi:molybdenum cofactor cytidylyltransferase